MIALKIGLNLKDVFSSIQWLFFIFANTVVIPLSIGAVFHLPVDVITMTMRVSFVLTGIACILQGWIGHKYPLMEGHAGLMWGVILNLGLAAPSLGMSYMEVGGGITTGILLAGGAIILIAAFNLISFIQKIFSPMVTSVYLFLLTFQLIFVFFNGMLETTEQGTLNLPVSLLSIGVVLLVSILKIKGNPILSNFSILIGIAVGWVLYAILFPGHLSSTEIVELSFTPFPLGEPNLEFGIIIVTFFACIINLSNTIASIQAAGELMKGDTGDGTYKKSFFITGFFTFIGAFFGLVPFTTYTSSIGFLLSTRIFILKPFFVGGILIIILGIIPSLCAFLVTMPLTIGNAVLFVAYLQLFGTAFNSLNGVTFTSNTIFRIAAPVLIGVSLMNLSPDIFSNLPSVLQPFLSNGLIMGMIISIMMETTMKWEKYEKVEV